MEKHQEISRRASALAALVAWTGLSQSIVAILLSVSSDSCSPVHYLLLPAITVAYGAAVTKLGNSPLGPTVAVFGVLAAAIAAVSCYL